MHPPKNETSREARVKQCLTQLGIVIDPDVYVALQCRPRDAIVHIPERNIRVLVELPNNCLVEAFLKN